MAQIEKFADAGGSARFHVADAVPHKKGALQIQAEVGRGPEQHARPRFAQEAVLLVAADAVFRVKRAERNACYGRAASMELPSHPAHEPEELAFAVVAASNARLICDDNGQKAANDRRGRQFKDSLNPLYLTITVIPASYTPLGDWTSTNDNYDTDIHFTSEEYKGEFNDYYYTAPKMGTIVDNYGGAVDTYHFYYEFKHGVLSAKVYDMETTGDGFSCSVENVTLELSYSGADDTVSCCMYYAEMAEDSWDVSYFNIIGDIDEENYSYPVVFERIG